MFLVLSPCVALWKTICLHGRAAVSESILSWKLLQWESQAITGLQLILATLEWTSCFLIKQAFTMLLPMHFTLSLEFVLWEMKENLRFHTEIHLSLTRMKKTLPWNMFCVLDGGGLFICINKLQDSWPVLFDICWVLYLFTFVSVSSE